MAIEHDVPTFDSSDQEPPPAREFNLAGKTLTTGERWEATFSVLGQAPQGCLADLAAAVTIQSGNIVYSSTSVVRFLRSVIVPGDELAFDALIRDKERMLPLEQLGEVMMWVAGLVADRPTGPLSSSTGGQRATGPSSEGDASLPATEPAGSLA